MASDTAVTSAYIKQIGSQISGSTMAKLRLSPRNATGGTDLYSQNFAWGTSLVGLPGRAGLNAGFGMGYNSLVWIKDAASNAMIFDPDTSNITPGFRFGFPVIEPAYYHRDASVWSYMMVAPSGGRTEFRQTSVSNTYETADSGYAQLTTSGATNPNDTVENIIITVTGTDGTQMKYEWKTGAYRCTRVLDRNGNYISMTYNADFGVLEKVTDTLGREINVSYDGEQYPIAITQNWKAGNGDGATTPHTWATFSYATKSVATNFSTTNVFGPPNGTVVKVLDRVIYADGSNTRFKYNGYLQMQKIRNFAADNHELNYVRTNLDSITTAQADCPRFTGTFSKAENFNNGTEVEVTNSIPTSSTYSLPDGTTGTAKFVDVALVGHPNGLYSRTWIEPSGWKEGLTVATEDCVSTGCTGTDRKRWTWTAWTQDNTGVSYMTNPRVTESRVGDATNTKKTEIEYWVDAGVSAFGLAKFVTVFGTDLTTVVKQTYATYNLASDYKSRRIIGLPSMVESWGKNDVTGVLEYVSKVTFAYDEEAFNLESNQNIQNVIRHDNTLYSANLVTGRGNLTSTTRHDVTGATAAVTSKTRYDIAGSPVAQIDPIGRKVRIGYTDVFNDNTNRNAYAYPTTLTDPAGTTLGDTNHSSTVKYRYDFGANVLATSPAPAGNTQGKISEREFDPLGRLSKDKVNNYGGAYTRYEFPTNGIQSKVYSTIVDTNNNNTADTPDEVLSESWSDGAGRVLRSRTEHPGSLGGWAATIAEYDILGRAKRTSVPTEVSVSNPNDPNSWQQSGDDATRGFLYTHQKYDWMGRVVRQINTDGIDQTTLNDSDTLITYEGCGCAGGLVTSVQGELVPRDDIPTQNARRVTKSYADILGRTWKNVSMKWDNITPYATTEYAFNARDQITLTRVTDNTSTVVPQTYQDTTAEYDGHGRVWRTHRPEQRDDNNNLKFTTMSYNADNSVNSITDGRGAVTNYSYNSRRLLTTKSWNVPTGSNINDPADVGFDYDAAGNRTYMADGLGTVSYSYDSLSRVTSELRQFSDQLSRAPSPNNGFNLQYIYTLGGSLKSLTDPFGDVISYSHDRAGRLSQVGGSPFGDQTEYLTDTRFRAWGGVKGVDYGNGLTMAQTYNDRLQPLGHTLTGALYPTTNKSYEYNKDGTLGYVQDNLNPIFDRRQVYDHQGRTVTGKSGLEARGGTVTTDQGTQLPYRQSFTFDAFSNVTSRNHLHWGESSHGDIQFNFNYTYQNNRISDIFSYDADGRTIYSPELNAGYDASGRMHDQVGAGVQTQRYFDGDGREAKSSVEDLESTYSDRKYYIRSSVLGGETVSETYFSGNKKKTFVFAAGAVIADQEQTDNSQTPVVNKNVSFKHWDASGMSFEYTQSEAAGTYDGSVNQAEIDTVGNNVGTYKPYPPSGTINPPRDVALAQPRGADNMMYSGSQWMTCSQDGIQIPCSMVRRALRMGSSVLDPSHGTNLGLPFLGGHFIWNPISGRVAPKLPNDTETTVYTQADGGTWEYLFFGNPKLGTRISPRTLSESDCNFLLNHLFGNIGSIAASYHEPNTLMDRRSTGEIVKSSLAGMDRVIAAPHFNTNIHMYGDPTGFKRDAAIYVPSNLNGSAPNYLTSFTTSGGKLFTSGEYKEKISEAYSNRFLFSYGNGLTILVAHVANTSGGKSDGDSLSSEYLKNTRLVGSKNLAGSYQIGLIGGPGGYTNGITRTRTLLFGETEYPPIQGWSFVREEVNSNEHVQEGTSTCLYFGSYVGDSYFQRIRSKI